MLAFEVFFKITSKKNSQKIDSFCVFDPKIPSCYIFEICSLYIHFSHQNTFFVILFRVLVLCDLGNF